jgi:hypothetical protein
MPKKPGEKNKPPPERAGPLRIDLPFEEAIRAALETPPEPPPSPRTRKRTRTR